MDFKAGIGSLNCRLCGAAYQMPIHHLHEPIDVFSEWLDDCEAAQNPSRAAAEGDTAAPRYQEEDEDEDDDIPEASGLGRASSQKQSASEQAASSSGQRQQYTDLGVVDSEDDDDED